MNDLNFLLHRINQPRTTHIEADRLENAAAITLFTVLALIVLAELL
jgi:hypothetical protein